VTPAGLARLTFPSEPLSRLHEWADRWEPSARRHTDPVGLQQLSDELIAYFGGNLRAFTCPVDMRGTPFQREVWAALLAIPFGETRSYADIAAAIGRPKAVRAVGAANGANPVPVVVPCHRVIGANGTLTGFGGGLDLKRWLLNHEANSCHAERYGWA